MIGFLALRAVAIFESAVAMYSYNDSSNFGADDLSCEQNLYWFCEIPRCIEKVMHNAMYMRDGCETIDLSLNSLVGGEDQSG